MIKWNEVTWYSRLGAIILFVGCVPAFSFYVGEQYEQATNIPQSVFLTKVVHDVKTITATADPLIADTYKPGCSSISSGILCNLTFSDGVPYSLLYVISATAKVAGEIEVYKNGKLSQTLSVPASKMMDTGFTPVEFMQAVDVNFDGELDLALRTCQGATGNECYIYYLYTNTGFVYSPEFSGTQGWPNAKKQEIETFFNEGCASDCYQDSTYKVVNNLPVLVEQDSQDMLKDGTYVKTTRTLVNGNFVVATSSVPARK
jgi:hypothetical protein